MFVGIPAQLRKTDQISTVEVAGVVLPVSSEVKSLGVIIDSRLSFKAHVNAVAKACNYHIWALRHIRPLLSQDVAHTLARSMVISKLDYCNAVLQGAPKTSVAILQRVQNSLARLVLQQKKFASAKPLLRSLHWLPVEQRITFKLAITTYKVRSTKTPSYIYDLLSDQVSVSAMTLRSSLRPLLHVGRTRTTSGEQAFRTAAPVLWNNLPADIQLASSLTV